VYPDGDVTYRSTNHTNELVTIAARGAGAKALGLYADGWYGHTRIIDNTQIYLAMKQAAVGMGVKHIILFIGDGMNIEHEIAGSRYLYGVDMGLAWHSWRNRSDGWGGFVATWDVTTYNKYAAAKSAPLYAVPAAPGQLGAGNEAALGYDVVVGGAAPFRLQALPYSVYRYQLPIIGR
jgi:alkaline phosphatase